MARASEKYPLDRVLKTAELASSLAPDSTPALFEALHDSDAAVRYWAVRGLLMRAPGGHKPPHAELLKLLDDSAPDVRIAAAETLVGFGSETDGRRALDLLVALADWQKNDVFTAMAALNAITAVGDKAAPVAAALKSLPVNGPAPNARFREYIPRLVEDLATRFK